jgi:hypothetical protein
MKRHDNQIADLQCEKKSLQNAFEEFKRAEQRFIRVELDDMRYYWREDRRLSAQFEQLAENIKSDGKTVERNYENRLEDIAHDIRQLERRRKEQPE